MLAKQPWVLHPQSRDVSDGKLSMHIVIAIAQMHTSGYNTSRRTSKHCSGTCRLLGQLGTYLKALRRPCYHMIIISCTWYRRSKVAVYLGV